MLGELKNFDWNHARAFLLTAELGSLSAAAKRLGIAQPTIGRQVAALEQSLGVSLFERSARGLSLTPNGHKLLAHVKDMEAAANQFSLTAQGHAQSLEGDICITATEAMAAYNLPPIITKLREAYPAIQVELIASNETQDLKRREADIAVRSYRPKQEDLIGRKVAHHRGHMYASADYVAKLRKPINTDVLNSAEFIGFDRDERILKHLQGYGLDVSAQNFPILANNHLVNWALAKQGLGISFMAEDIGDAEPGMQRVIPGYAAFDYEVWLVSHKELRTNLRVKTVFDFLHAELSAALNSC